MEKPLTEEEIVKIRAIIDSDEKMKWLWASLRTWAIWITAIVGGVYVGWDFIKKVLKAAVAG